MQYPHDGGGHEYPPGAGSNGGEQTDRNANASTYSPPTFWMGTLAAGQPGSSSPPSPTQVSYASGQASTAWTLNASLLSACQ